MHKERAHLFFDRQTIDAVNIRPAAGWPLASLPAWWRTFLFRLLTGRQLSVYMYLLWCMADGACYPSAYEISSYVGLSGPTMVFDALQTLERYGLIVRERRMVAHLRSRRNLYRMPAAQFTVRRLLEHGFLDHELYVKGLREQYDSAAREELHDALQSILGERFREFEHAVAERKIDLLLEALNDEATEETA